MILLLHYHLFQRGMDVWLLSAAFHPTDDDKLMSFLDLAVCKKYKQDNTIRLVQVVKSTLSF